MKNLKLFMILLGYKPEGYNTEQHDVMFAVGESIADCKPQMLKFMDSKKLFETAKLEEKVHLDRYVEIDVADGHMINVVEGKHRTDLSKKIFFINLGGYKHDIFREEHKPLLIVATDIKEARVIAKKDIFMAECITSDEKIKPHVDDQMFIDIGPDVDDAFQIDIPGYGISCTPSTREDSKSVIKGYFMLKDLVA